MTDSLDGPSSRKSSTCSSTEGGRNDGGTASASVGLGFARFTTIAQHRKGASAASRSEVHQSPLHQYLRRSRSIANINVRRNEFSQWLFGTPHSQAFNLRQLRIHNTSDHKFHDIISNLMGVREHNASDVNDVVTMLRDTRVHWSYFDIIAPDTRIRSPVLLCTWSIIGQTVATFLAMLAFFSIWYSTLICAFHDVLLADDTFYPGGTPYQIFAGVDIGADVLYCLGILSQLRTTFIDPLIYVETCNPEKIRRRCICSPIWWADLLSCTPGILLQIFPTLSVHIQLLKIIRMFCLVTWIFDLKHTSLLVMRPYWHQILRLICFIFLIGHLGGCFWHSIASPRNHPLLDASAGGARWALPENADLAILLYYAYFCKTGLYLALGIIVQGYSVAENALIVILAPLGAVTNALILSTIIVLVSRSTALETRSLERMEHLKQAISTQGLPASIQLRILAYHTQQRIQRSRVRTNGVFRGLSMQLHFELNLVLYFNLIIGADIFKKSHPRVLRQIVLVFEDKLFLPGDYVCRFADEGSEMYFVFKGLLSVISEQFAELCQMGKGQHFGEVALLTGQRRTAYVRANLFCMLASLSKKNFDSIMHEYPQQLELIMEQMSEKRRNWMQKLVRANASIFSGEGKDTAPPSIQPEPVKEEDGGEGNSALSTTDCSQEHLDSPRHDSNIQGTLGGSVFGGSKAESEEDEDEESSSEESQHDDDEDEDAEDDEDEEDGSDTEENPLQLIALISKRCSMARDTHNQFASQLERITQQQQKNSDLAQELNTGFERYLVEHVSQERTVSLECICSDVEMMYRGIKDGTLAMELAAAETGPSSIFSQAIAKGIGANDGAGLHGATTSVGGFRFHRTGSADHMDADRTVL